MRLPVTTNTPERLTHSKREEPLSDRKKIRLSKLRQAVIEQNSLHVKDAAELLNVTEMTVRRDLSENPDLFNYYGGHIVLANDGSNMTSYDLDRATEVFSKEKKAACKHCLQYIKAKDTIFVDCGTTLSYLVNMLQPDLEVTLVCFALNIADQAIRKPKIKLVLLGGVYQPATASFSPINPETSFEGLAFNVAFLTATGVDQKIGATCTTFREAIQKRAAISRAQKSILVADTSKTGVVRPACFGKVEDFDLVITEHGISDPSTASD